MLLNIISYCIIKGWHVGSSLAWIEFTRTQPNCNSSDPNMTRNGVKFKFTKTRSFSDWHVKIGSISGWRVKNWLIPVWQVKNRLIPCWRVNPNWLEILIGSTFLTRTQPRNYSGRLELGFFESSSYVGSIFDIPNM